MSLSAPYSPLARSQRGSDDSLMTSKSMSLLGRWSPLARLPKTMTFSGFSSATMRRTISR